VAQADEQLQAALVLPPDLEVVGLADVRSVERSGDLGLGRAEAPQLVLPGVVVAGIVVISLSAARPVARGVR